MESERPAVAKPGAFCRGAITVPFQIRHHQPHMPRMRVFRSIGAVMRERVVERS
jgi:hypothetical protein